MAAIRRAECVWEGDLASGLGTVSAATSKAFGGLPVTWASRTESADGRGSLLRGGGTRGPTRGQNVEYVTGITLDEAFQGTTRTLNLQGESACGTCGGGGEIAGAVCHEWQGAGRVGRPKGLAGKRPAGCRGRTALPLPLGPVSTRRPPAAKAKLKPSNTRRSPRTQKRSRPSNRLMARLSNRQGDGPLPV